MKSTFILNIVQREKIEMRFLYGAHFYKFLFITILCCSFFSFAEAQKTDSSQEVDHSEHKHHSEQKPDLSETSKKDSEQDFYIPNVEVLTQDGKRVEFFNDLVKGKKVLISFIFTTCRLTCPMVGRNFEKLQTELGDKLGKDVSLISVSTDPLVDSPEVFKKWGEKFNRREGWTLVTGGETKMSELLQTLTGSTRQDEGRHTSLLILYDGVSGKWETTSSLMEPRVLLDKLYKLERSNTK